jgi:hypothetical protein
MALKVWGAANNFENKIVLWGYATSTKEEPVESATFKYVGYDANGKLVSKTKVFDTVFLSSPSISLQTDCSNKYTGSCTVTMKTKNQVNSYDFEWGTLSSNNITAGSYSVSSISVQASGTTGTSFKEDTKLTYISKFTAPSNSGGSSGGSSGGNSGGSSGGTVTTPVVPKINIQATATCKSVGMDLWTVTVTYNTSYTYDGPYGSTYYDDKCELWLYVGYKSKHFTGKKAYSGSYTFTGVTGVGCPTPSVKFCVGSYYNDKTIYWS